MAKKIAVVLAGCGNKDGTEITEAVSLIVALSQAGVAMTFFAPDKDYTPKNFLTNEPLGEKRNLMLEAARITRSRIVPLDELNASDFDGLALPGGFGAALHLSTWATEGAKCSVLPALDKAIREFHAQSKPIAAICIAPAVVARVLGSRKVTVTLGNDPEVAGEIAKTGAQHETCPVDDYLTDRLHKIITTPAYMYDDAKPHQIWGGISGLAREFVEMA